jgi:polyferredoxin
MSGRGLAKYRKWFQAIFFAVFIGLLIAASTQATLPIPSQLFLLLDPLIALIALISGQPAIIIAVYSSVIVIITLLFGRVFCGYACPLGTIIDQFDMLSGVFKVKQDRFKRLKIMPLAILAVVLTLGLYNIGVVMIFDPISLTTRAATISISSVESLLDQFATNSSGTSISLDNGGFGRGAGVDISGGLADRSTGGSGYLTGSNDSIILPSSGWMLALFMVIIGLNILGKRFWCRYLCPLGGLLGLIGRVPIYRRKVDASICTSCMKCAKNCDMKAVTKKGKSTDASSCILCLECADVCPKGAISTGLKPELTTEIPSRRTALAIIGGTITAAAVAPLNSQAATEESTLIRPPGVSNEELFLSKCIRCGECVAACPTKVLQHTFLQQGIGALWTPYMELSAAVCAYSCNECGKVCPTGAIEFLTLEKKQAFVIGTAVIDDNTCFRCGICARVCPVPGGAITIGGLGQSNSLDGEMQSRRRGLPGMFGMRNRTIGVDKEKCIGCGICVAVCPMRGVKPIKIVKNEKGVYERQS